MAEKWYVYDAEDGDNYVMRVFGPIAPGEKRADGLAWDAPFLSGDFGLPMLLNLRAEFDHEPTELEQIELVPEKHRDEVVNAVKESEAANLDFTPEEIAALSMAVEQRIAILASTRDRQLATTASLKIPDVCNEQIAVLSDLYNRLGLRESTWPVH